ncbi:phosphonate metabolism protein/1,5-bisphosphokinase (PRPP-forming) PhnN [Aquamicrobium sp. LC103]|uniref:phosphonate metabolism protein/1,5-bisphosphokinase (PRPP-forming) PhnN n=1 Tax=Aquamicrobium sp. LC103 TaxID=1120658 RepID=UPI00063EB919|nr:phosphonate metabolism protein/1,5-bisphosphokinase (PRPP-forming) PhnN [Aquamicrobium sp. LC103]TKT74660.1 phosphonate metabolism protein/1,5-bisphosphokinase (PRPP-forming) PhnN [Aquamicrobium sp. LC103]
MAFVDRDLAVPIESSARPTFIAVVGPSGAGKDSLIAVARERLAEDDRFVFARRIVTREADPDLEDHDCLDAKGFQAAAEAGRFCVSWQAHGLSYGLPASLLDDYASGRVVIANVSRKALDEIAAGFPALHVVEVTAPGHVLMERLLSRGRETREEVARRVARAIEQGVPAGGWTYRKIENAGGLDEAAADFVRTLRSIAARPGEDTAAG